VSQASCSKSDRHKFRNYKKVMSNLFASWSLVLSTSHRNPILGRFYQMASLSRSPKKISKGRVLKVVKGCRKLARWHPFERLLGKRLPGKFCLELRASRKRLWDLEKPPCRSMSPPRLGAPRKPPRAFSRPASTPTQQGERKPVTREGSTPPQRLRMPTSAASPNPPVGFQLPRKAPDLLPATTSAPIRAAASCSPLSPSASSSPARRTAVERSKLVFLRLFPNRSHLMRGDRGQ
jgi:hypothetical protein